MKTKYKSIRFCHPSSDKGCNELLIHYISKSKKCHAPECVPSSASAIQNLSKAVENTIRFLYGSERSRFVMYDVFYQGEYHTKMKEVDIVKMISKNKIVVGEIKFTSNRTQAIRCGSRQLRAITDILHDEFTDIKCVLIIIDLINDHSIDENCDSIFGNTRTIKNESGFQYELIEISASILFNYALRNNAGFIDTEDLQSAVDEALKNFENRMQYRINKISDKIEKAIYENWEGNTIKTSTTKRQEFTFHHLMNNSLSKNRIGKNIHN